MFEYSTLFALLFIGSIGGLLGGVVFLFNTNLRLLLCKFSVPFAAGILISVALLDLIPESVDHIGEDSYLFILVSFLSVFIFENLIFAVHHHNEQDKSVNQGSAVLVVAGDILHNFVDGVAITTAYLVEPSFGVIVALSSFLHEIPHEIGDFGILLNAGWNRVKVFAVNFTSALTTFLGAIFVLSLAEENDDVIGILLALSAGLFLYLGASNFLPKGDKHDKDIVGKVITVMIGAAIMILIGLVFPHEH